jgi:hypothetical protein
MHTPRRTRAKTLRAAIFTALLSAIGALRPTVGAATPVIMPPRFVRLSESSTPVLFRSLVLTAVFAAKYGLRLLLGSGALGQAAFVNGGESEGRTAPSH